jgi:uncharacterized sulfatase
MGDPRGLGRNDQPSYDQLHKSTSITMSDLDASLTKAWLITHRDKPDVRPLFDLTLNLRLEEEIYDLRRDRDQQNNIANEDDYAAKRSELSARLMSVLDETADPRLTDAFDQPPYIDNQRNSE